VWVLAMSSAGVHNPDLKGKGLSGSARFGPAYTEEIELIKC